MSAGPEKQPESKGGNGWLIGFGALFVGYLLGQNSTSTVQQPAYAEATPPPLVRTQTTTPDGDMSAVDTSASLDLDALANAAASDSANAEESASTGNDPAYAYTPSSTYSTFTQPAENDGADTGSVEVASTAGETTDPTLEAAGAAATAIVVTDRPWTKYAPTTSAPTYQAPRYSYTPPAASYSGSSSKCEGVGCYGVMSNVTGLPRTTYVRGYVRKDGTYVQPHYRSKRRR